MNNVDITTGKNRQTDSIGFTLYRGVCPDVRHNVHFHWLSCLHGDTRHHGNGRPVTTATAIK